MQRDCAGPADVACRFELSKPLAPPPRDAGAGVGGLVAAAPVWRKLGHGSCLDSGGKPLSFVAKKNTGISQCQVLCDTTTRCAAVDIADGRDCFLYFGQGELPRGVGSALCSSDCAGGWDITYGGFQGKLPVSDTVASGAQSDGKSYVCYRKSAGSAAAPPQSAAARAPNAVKDGSGTMVGNGLCRPESCASCSHSWTARPFCVGGGRDGLSYCTSKCRPRLPCGGIYCLARERRHRMQGEQAGALRCLQWRRSRPGVRHADRRRRRVRVLVEQRVRAQE